MKQESLDVALDLIFKNIMESDIDTLDKYELLKNLKELLTDVNTYNQDIKTLQKSRKKWLRWKEFQKIIMMKNGIFSDIV